MIRTIFKHDTPKQKEFENLHGSSVRSLNRISSLEGNPRWHSGEGLPSKGIGGNRDFYLDKTNGNIYEKVNGIWSL